jgi:hypothetical protein
VFRRSREGSELSLGNSQLSRCVLCRRVYDTSTLLSIRTLTSTRGFSAGVNPDDFKGSYPSGYDPLWEDMLHLHEQKPFHCMVGGGDQIYGDPVTLEPELRSEPRTIHA